MVSLSTAQITGIISLALILSGAVIVNNLEKTYYCPSEDNVKQCLRVSDSGLTCYYLLAEDITKGDRCTSGKWELIEGRLSRQATPSANQVRVSANSKEWLCEAPEQVIRPYAKCYSDGFEAYLGELV